jgi:hypothetical protein
MADRLIRITTALAVLTVAVIAAIISYRHAYELVRTHGESGATARLVPFTVDGLIWAASMVILDANRRARPVVPPLAAWSLGVGIVATIGANLAHGLDHGPIGALVSAWPAVALVGSYELCMLVIRPADKRPAQLTSMDTESPLAPIPKQPAPTAPTDAPTLEHVVRAQHKAGSSQRAISRDLGIDRRKIKRIIDQAV